MLFSAGKPMTYNVNKSFKQNVKDQLLHSALFYNELVIILLNDSRFGTTQRTFTLSEKEIALTVISLPSTNTNITINTTTLRGIDITSSVHQIFGTDTPDCGGSGGGS